MSGTSDEAGLVGTNAGFVNDSYWDTGSSGLSSSDGGTGLATAEITGASAETNMTGFDFGATWGVDASYPFLCDNRFDPTCSADTGDTGDKTPDITNYQVTAAGEEITVAFDSDENRVDIEVAIIGAEDTRLGREDFEGYRANYQAVASGQYTVELVSAREGAANDGADGETFRESVSIENGTSATATPTATPSNATATATTTASPTATATESPTETALETASPTPMGTDGDGPGLGVLVALVALSGVGYVLRRRRSGDA